MAHITVRDVPDKIKTALRVQAAQSGISLEEYVRHILLDASERDHVSAPDIVALARQHFAGENGVELPDIARHTQRDIPQFDD